MEGNRNSFKIPSSRFGHHSSLPSLATQLSKEPSNKAFRGLAAEETSTHTTPTKGNLERALSSKTVGLGTLASKVNNICENITNPSLLNIPYSVINVSQDTFEFGQESTLPSGNVTIATEENLSTLLEISGMHRASKYEWFWDGVALPGCKTYQSSCPRPQEYCDELEFAIKRARQFLYHPHNVQYNAEINEAAKALRYYSPGSFLCLHKSDIDWDGS